MADEKGLADNYCVEPSTALLRYDFVLLTEEERSRLREERARDEAERQGGLRVENGLLVPK